MTVLPDRAASDAAWARVLAARDAGGTGHREIAAYVRLHGLRIMPTDDAHHAAEITTRVNGYTWGTAIDPYTGTWIVSLLMNACQIIVGDVDGAGVAERWTYTETGLAWVAMQRWERAGFVGEPEGWVRHQPSDRRRTYRAGGDYTEEVRP